MANRKFGAITERGRILAVILLPLVAIPILAGWVGDITREWIGQGERPGDAWLLVAALCGLFVSTWVLFKFGRRYLPARVLRHQERFPPRQALITMLSPCNNLQQDDGAFSVKENGSDIPTRLSGRLKEDTAPRSGLPRWTWQQVLRGAQANVPALRRIVLAGSENASGRPEQLDLCRRFLGAYFPAVRIEAADRATNFEDIDDVMDMLRQAIRRLNDEGFTDRDIIIDCTGGPKPTSIAAALVTLDHPDLMFQYVSNESNNCRVFAFNVASELNAG